MRARVFCIYAFCPLSMPLIQIISLRLTIINSKNLHIWQKMSTFAVEINKQVEPLKKTIMNYKVNYKVKLNLFSAIDNSVDATVFVVVADHLLAVILSRGTISLDEFQRGVSPRTYSRYKALFAYGDLYASVIHAKVLPS